MTKVIDPKKQKTDRQTCRQKRTERRSSRSAQLVLEVIMVLLFP